jgi:hypothetical protein
VRFILPVFSLSLKHLRASQANSYSQAGRATLFPPFFSCGRKHAPKGRPQHVFIDSRNVSHITSLPYLHFFERCHVAPCKKCIHSSFSLFLIMFTKWNSLRGVPLLRTLILGTFSSYKFVAKMKCDSTSGSLPWGSNFCKVPQFEPAFQDFLEFLKGSFAEHPKMDQMEPFTLSRL